MVKLIESQARRRKLLVKNYRSEGVALFLGAGVSTGCKLPDWHKLICRVAETYWGTHARQTVNALLANGLSLPAKASALHDLRYEELFHVRVCVVVAPQHPFARRRAIPIVEVAAEPLIGLTREDYPGYYDYVSMIFSKVKQKPRVVEEYDSYYGIISAVEAGTGVALGADVLGHSLGNRVKFLYLTPEPKPVAVGIVGTKGRLSPAAEKFWQCAKEAASPAARSKTLRTPR